MSWAAIIASFFGAVLSALGMGGGGILLIYLTAFGSMEQIQAQGVNLVFFVPTAIIAICFHAKNKLVRWRTALPCILAGLPGVYLGWKAATWLGSDLLSKIFGAFLLLIAARELWGSFKKGGANK